MPFDAEYRMSGDPEVIIEGDEGVRVILPTGEKKIVVSSSRARARRFQKLLARVLNDADRDQQSRMEQLRRDGSSI